MAKVTKKGTSKKGRKVRVDKLQASRQLTKNQMKNTKGGADKKGGIEVTDYGFGVSMPVTTSR